MAPLIRLTLVASCLMLGVGCLLAARKYTAVFVVLLLALAWQQVKQRPASTSHGSAKLATLATLHNAGMYGHDEGLVLGRASLLAPSSLLRNTLSLASPLADSEIVVRAFLASLHGKPEDGFIRVRDYVHLLTCAPSGAGKSISSILPNMLSYSGAIACVDVKGELYRATAEHRWKRLGHKIIRLDPFGVAGSIDLSSHLNPLDFIDENRKSFLDDCRSVADLIVVEKGTETDPHWNSRSIDVLTSLIAFVCAYEIDPAKRSLTIVRDLLSSPEKFAASIAEMKRSRKCDGLIALLGNSLEWLKDRELNSVISSVSRHIAWLQSPVASAAVSKSTFDPRWLWSGKVTVYLILPHDKLTILAPLMRIWLGTMLKMVSGNGASEKHQILFIIDELATLGKMRPIEEAVTLLRGFGVRLWLFVQSLDQLKKCYGDSASIILDNMSIQQYYGITSYDTGDYLSKRIGDATIFTESLNNNVSRSRQTGHSPHGESGNLSNSHGLTVSEQARRILKPEEILVLPSHVGLVIYKNMPIIPVELVKHFSAPEFAGGRTGQSRRLGVGALVLSVCVLGYSMAFAAVMASLPAPAPFHRPVVLRAVQRPANMLLRRQPSGVRYLRR